MRAATFRDFEDVIPSVFDTNLLDKIQNCKFFESNERVDYRNQKERDIM